MQPRPKDQSLHDLGFTYQSLRDIQAPTYLLDLPIDECVTVNKD